MMTKITTEMRALKVVSKANSYKEIKKDIGWFSRLVRIKVLSRYEKNQVLKDLEYFIESRRLAEAEAMAEAQMAEALRGMIKKSLLD